MRLAFVSCLALPLAFVRLPAQWQQRARAAPPHCLCENSMEVQPTPTICSSRVLAVSALHGRSGGILVYLRSPSFYPKFRGQNRSVLNAPEQRKTSSSHRGGSRLATLPVSCPLPNPPVLAQPVLYQPLQARTCPTSIVSASAGSYVSTSIISASAGAVSQYCISLCRHLIPVLRCEIWGLFCPMFLVQPVGYRIRF